MKRKMIALILCVIMLSALFAGVVYATSETASTDFTAEIAEAYGGARGVVSMTFDDGSYETAVYLDQQFALHGLRASTMMIVRSNFETKTTDADGNTVYVEDTAKTDKWKTLYSAGRLAPESHTYTHMPLPTDAWAESNAEKWPNVLENNTEENYQIELVNPIALIKEYTGYDAICLAPSNNTLSDGAMAVVMDNYYAVRQGRRFNTTTYELQSLDPAVGSSEAGGWYNLKMMGFSTGIDSYIPNALDVLATQGGWLVTLCHGVYETSGDATYAQVEPVFQKMGELQNEGKIWVTTFGDATRYIRERQNSTVSYSCTADSITLNVTMADMTEDGLPLGEDIFNHPLTVKIQLPEGTEKVTYTTSGEDYSANTFVEEGKTYAYVNVVPNSGEIELTRIVSADSKSIFSQSDLAAALDKDGEYRLVADINVGESVDLTMAASNVKIDLNGHTITFVGKNTITVPADKSLEVVGGTVLISYRYDGGTKGFSIYWPVVKNETTGEDGSVTVSYSLAEAETTPSASDFREEDQKYKISSPAFSVTGGTLLIDSVLIERNVSTSYASELLSVKAGGVTVNNSELTVSAPAEAWCTAKTYMIYVERSVGTTSLSFYNTRLYEVDANPYYDGVLYSANKPKIDATTGEYKTVSYPIDSGDNIRILYVSGKTSGANVKISLDDCTVRTAMKGFVADNAPVGGVKDSFTMTDSRYTAKNASNSNERAFVLYSDITIENCFLDGSNNTFFLHDNESLSVKGSYVLGTHAIREPNNTNTIYLENSYFQQGLFRWDRCKVEANPATAPTVTICGNCYTSVDILDTPPLTESYTNYFFNIVKTNETDTFTKATPAWYIGVRHADNSVMPYGADANNIPQLSDGAAIYLWKSYTGTSLIVNATGKVSVRSFGVSSNLIITGDAVPLFHDDVDLGEASQIDAEGAHTYYINQNQTFNKVFDARADGYVTVLQKDLLITAGIWNKTNIACAVDLNGYVVYTADTIEGTGTDDRVQPNFGVNKGSFYVYSSREGGKIYNGYGSNRSGILLRVDGGKLSIGYGLDGKPTGERIELVGGQILQMYGGDAYIDNVDWFNLCGDNSANIEFQETAERLLYISNSNLYIKNHARIVSYRDSDNEMNLVNTTIFENCNIYAYDSSKVLMGLRDSKTVLTVPQMIYLKSTNVYNATIPATEMMRVTVEGNCKITTALNEYVTVPTGNGIVYSGGKVTVSDTQYASGALWNVGEMTSVFNKSYTYSLEVVSSSSYQKSLYSNVSLDVALDINLYFPVDETLYAVLVEGVNLLDTTKIETINGADYYTVTVSKPPKDQYQAFAVEAQYKSVSGDTVTDIATYTFEYSFVQYAKGLMGKEEANYTGDTLSYLVDSKALLLDILYYVKTVITNYSGLEGDALTNALSDIDTLLGEHTPSSEDLVPTVEEIQTYRPSGIGAAASFNLDSAVGFYLIVYDSFTGDVTVKIGDRESTGSFTASEAPTGEVAGYVALDDLFASELYDLLITITMKGTNGENTVDEEFTYNLASYVNTGVGGEVANTLYAYAKGASAYNQKYTVGTIE